MKTLGITPSRWFNSDFEVSVIRRIPRCRQALPAAAQTVRPRRRRGLRSFLAGKCPSKRSLVTALWLLCAAWTACAQMSGAFARGQGSEIREAAALPSRHAGLSPRTPPKSAAATVFDYYFGIHTALADDSMEIVAANASVIAEIVHKDTTGAFPAQIVSQAQALAKAKSLAEARQAFAALSKSLIAYLRVHSTPAGTYYEVYCPIAKASWVQTSETVKNPYSGLGSANPNWGRARPAVVKARYKNRSESLLKLRKAILPGDEILLTGSSAIGDRYWQPRGFRLFNWTW